MNSTGGRLGAEDLKSLAVAHPALCVSSLVVVMSVVHLVLVAGFDPQTVRTLMFVADPTQVLLSTVAITFAYLFAGAAIGSYGAVAPGYKRVLNQPFGMQFLIAFSVLVFVAAALRIALVVWVVLLACVLWAAIQRRRMIRAAQEKREGRYPLTANDYRWFRLSFAILTAGLAVNLLSQPWVPQENVQLKNGSQVSTFIVGADGAFTALFDDQRNEVTWVPTASIRDRELCEVGSEGWLWARIPYGQNYPKCVD